MVSVIAFTQQVLVTLAFALLAHGIAIPNSLDKRDGSGVVTLDFNVVKKPLNLNATALYPQKYNKRADIPIGLIDQGASYASTIQVGSNNQQITVDIDTGSSDLWFVASDATCTNPQVNCKAEGTYDSSSSSSYKNLGDSFQIVYGDQTSSQGTWSEDTVKIGAATIKNQKFADVDTTSVSEGILGIGYKSGESLTDEYGFPTTSSYDNVPLSLKNQGIIKTNAYSLYLNEPGAQQTGQLIFGGIDHAKYSGNLISEAVTLQDRLTIKANSINYNGNTQSLGDVLLDSGTTLTYLPYDTAQALASQVGAYYIPNPLGGGNWFIDCDANTNGTVVYSFPNGASISVPLSEFVFNSGSFCLWGIQSISGLDFSILGDNFLRHAYSVFNLDDNTISIAQVKYTSDSNIIAI
ncbi:unnamed protein product [Candida verbasci]|uniref:candidapepsin n=1 Tax=Candida verbasci TaxID=1227364 RepID=A0A9W4XE01_9ASCO|nr:unnamed protein product [Candida verbasci]